MRFDSVEIGQLFWWRSELCQRVGRGRDRYGAFNAVQVTPEGLIYALFMDRLKVRPIAIGRVG